MRKKISEILKFFILIVLVGLGISGLVGISPNDLGYYDFHFFYVGVFITLCLLIIGEMHILLDKKYELLGFLGAVILIIFSFGYIPLRMIYWSVPQPWVWIAFPALIIVAVLVPVFNPQLSKEMAEEYISPSPEKGVKFWKFVSFWVPIIGVGLVFIAKIFESPSGLFVFSLMGFGAYIGMLWTIQTNVHNFIQKRKKDKKAKDE